MCAAESSTYKPKERAELTGLERRTLSEDFNEAQAHLPQGEVLRKTHL